MTKKKEPSFQVKICDDFLRAMWSDEFVWAREHFRKKFELPEYGFHQKDDAHKHFPKEKAEGLYLALTPLLKILKLSENFREALFNDIVFNGREGLPTKNFKVLTRPNAVFEKKTGEILRHPHEVILVTFKSLDGEEQRLAIKELQSAWRKYFPSYLTKRTNLRNKDIATKYLVKAEMEKRRKPSKEEGFYLKELARSYGRDSFLYKNEKKKKSAFEKKEGYSTGDVAKKLTGTKKKAGAIRVAHSRLKKKMGE